eukprot:CAMPEP_0116048806 /NCGR_PEP_ID=MMETSP0321-20121206/29801_1 /TAXON_ID=163516 /ORGANISM="Leptocylindrus danicus var. danicus, Strain B650" /LENGTH=39 /DNA_ID= /DNA_START= /DNA_END= /DNA_ORIENTATION=
MKFSLTALILALTPASTNAFSVGGTHLTAAQKAELAQTA